MTPSLPTHTGSMALGDRAASSRPVPKVLLLAGFLALAVTISLPDVFATSGYELSIYGSTPVVFWVGIGVSLLVSLSLSLYAGFSPRTRLLAMFLGILSFCAVLGLPLSKGYYYYGRGDALTHLGWVKDIAAGQLRPLEFLYPGMHVTSVFVKLLADISYRRAILLVVFVFALVFVLFVPLCVSLLSNNRLAAATGLFSAMLFLPVNNVSAHYFAHPTSQAILFAPFVLYVLLRYLGSGSVRERRVSGWGVALALAGVAMLLIHPQQVANLLIIYVGICTLQFIYRRLDPRSAISSQNRMYGQTALLTVAFVSWAATHNRSTQTVTNLVTLLTTPLGGAPGGEAAQRSASLAQIGGSIEGLFVKLFLLTTIFAILTAALTLQNLFGSTDETDDSTGYVRCLSISLVPLFGLFLVYFLSSMTTQHYRQIGFLAFLATVLGAVALSRGITGLGDRFSFTPAYSTLVACFTVFLLLSIPVVYASPIIFQPSYQVPETTMEGYRSSFDYRSDANVPYVGIRDGADREVDALYGTYGDDPVRPVSAGAVPPEVFRQGNFTEYYDEPRYFVVSEEDRLREVVVYEGFRYPESGFERLEETRGLNRVLTNGPFRVYRISDTDDAPNAGASFRRPSPS